jgi:hypothetical protein
MFRTKVAESLKTPILGLNVLSQKPCRSYSNDGIYGTARQATGEDVAHVN